MCAVVVTHARAPLWAHLITMPFIVTTDNAAAARRELWGAKYINVGVFEGTERAIGAHIHGGINAAFDAFPACETVAVLEDDVEISADYFAAVATATAVGAGCFTCINDQGGDSQVAWSPGWLRPVTYSAGIGVAFTRRLWATKLNHTWGVGYWDNFLRFAVDLVCLSPEITRCRHHAHKLSTHGTGGLAAALNQLPTWAIDNRAQAVAGFAVRGPPLERQRPCDSKQSRVDSHRGTFYGLDAVGCRVFHPPTPSGLHFVWVTGPTASSCDAACAGQSLACSPVGLRSPRWEFLPHFKGCTVYGSESGRELPSSIAAGNQVVCNVPWFGNPVSCAAWHPLTKRLCPCFRPTKHNVLYFK